jgi:hypothetical protein
VVVACGWQERQRRQAVVARAFAQACDEAGLDPHPAGECPGLGCPCEDRADQIEARALELVEAELGPLAPA